MKTLQPDLQVVQFPVWGPLALSYDLCVSTTMQQVLGMMPHVLGGNAAMDLPQLTQQEDEPDELTCSSCQGTGEGWPAGTTSSCTVCRGHGTLQVLPEPDYDYDPCEEEKWWNREDRWT